MLSDGITQLISSLPDYEVVGVVVDGLKVYAACQQLHPDLVILDLGLPGMDGNDVIHQLKQRWVELTIIVLTADNNEHRAKAALSAGAISYILKRSPQQTLLSALQMAAAGRSYIDPSLDEQQIIKTDKLLDGQVRLTVRERQILKLIAEGSRNRDIAESLKITIKTVETHRLNLMRKLDAHSAVELTNWAIRLGIHN